MKTIYFKTPLVFDMYLTEEEIDMADEVADAPLIIFQESREKDPIFFKTWEEAHQHALKYWKKINIRRIW